MLRGRFGATSGQPYIEGLLLIPRLQISADISLIVDTGADNCVLTPLDGQRIGVNYAALNTPIESVGFGGISTDFVEPAWLVFSEPKRCLYAYKIGLLIATPTPDIQTLPSVLGRDVLDNWRMTYDKPKGRITFKVLSADMTIPIS